MTGSPGLQELEAPAVHEESIAPGLQDSRDIVYFSDHDLASFKAGSHGGLHRILGAHPVQLDGLRGTHFAVWAPGALRVSVIGDFNGWNREASPLLPVASSGIWSGFVPQAGAGGNYKYFIQSRAGSHGAEKADPFAFRCETPPRTASVVWDLDYRWGDARWMAGRRAANGLRAPISIYEVHLGSWMRVPEEGNRWLTYRELAPRLADYLEENHFTHLEVLPLQEHPFYGSWGYQPTGFFAPTSRYGSPQDFMFLVDHLHQRGLGVILDWVPFHFPTDGHGLSSFDGTHLYAHPDPRRGFQPEWRTSIFDFGRPEVRSFLLSSALFWLSTYHLDGLRVDAVSFMLHLNYGRKQWLPNEHGGTENLHASGFLRMLNDEIRRLHPDTLTIAEEATAWPKVSRPTEEGGLGFSLKWDMGWMHDTLEYLRKPPHRRKPLLNKLTFRMLYAHSENFVLELSHDEVVHIKGSLLSKMPGDSWQKLANLRLLFAYLYGLPGKKLLFMGGEFAQPREWNHDQSLDWHLLREPAHQGVKRCLADLNRLYRDLPALHELDCEPDGFEWIACDDFQNSVLTFLRKARSSGDLLLLAFNFLPQAHRNYRVGVPRPGAWEEVLNTDAREYGGGGVGNSGASQAADPGWNHRPHSLSLTLPPLGAVFLRSRA
jgi:1,4-alpha-glucan branching enzyme